MSGEQMWPYAGIEHFGVVCRDPACGPCASIRGPIPPAPAPDGGRPLDDFRDSFERYCREACGAKPGSPLLCADCLHNRDLVERLKRVVVAADAGRSALRAQIEALLMPRGDCLTCVGSTSSFIDHEPCCPVPAVLALLAQDEPKG